MTWRTIAAKDVRDAGRSKTVWLLFALLFALVASFTAVHVYVGEQSFSAYVDELAGLFGLVLPLLGLVLGYKSIAHERISGSLFLSLSFPHSRRDLVVGKVVGRTIVLLAPTLVALAVAGVAGIALFGTDGVAFYPWFVLVTALYGTAFVAVAIGLSASTTVDRRLSLGALGAYLLLVTFWDNLHTTTLLVLHRFDTEVVTAMPDWALLFRLVKPSESYYRLVSAGFDSDRAARYVADAAPLYVDWWMGLVLLVAWIAVPLAVAARRFRNADL